MTVVTLGDVAHFVISRHVADQTDIALREAGLQGAEMFVLWTGHVSNGTFTAAGTYVPGQVAHRLPEGLCVTVDADELHKLNLWLYDKQQTLAVQVHTHPGRAYHSTTDDTYPIVTQRGGLSIVVPDFAVGGVRGPGTATYRLGDSGWQRIRTRATRHIVHIDPSTPKE